MRSSSPRFWRRVLLAAVSLASIVSTSASADTTLRWKFVKGDVHHYTLTSTHLAKVVIQGKAQVFSRVEVIELKWVIKDVDEDGNARVTQSIDRIKSTANLPGRKVEYDSSDAKVPADRPTIAPVFRALRDNPFELTMSPRGEISDVKVPVRLVEPMKGASPHFWVEWLTNIPKEATLVLPKAPIADGGKWTDKKTIKTPAWLLLQDCVYTLEGKTAGISKIGVAMTIDILKKEGQDTEVKLRAQDTKGTKGSYRFDNEKGFLQSSELIVKYTVLTSTNGQKQQHAVESKVTMVSTPPPAK